MRRFRSRHLSGTDRLITAAVIAVIALSAVLCVLLIVRGKAYVPAADTGVPFTENGPEGSASRADGKNADGPSPYIRGKERYNFLVLGVDRAAGLADTIMVVSVKTDGCVSVVQIPRDTYVNYRGRDAKINSVYLQSGAEAVKAVIGSCLCVNIDYTVTVGTEAFRDAVDAIGGVEIDVPEDMDYEDPYQDLSIHIKKGKQVLMGADAEGFVRFRSGYSDGDLGRIDAQKTFMKALLTKLRTEIGLSEASALAEAILPTVSTDLGTKDCLWFVKTVLGENSSGNGRLTMLTLPGKPVYSEELKQSFYVIGREAVIETVNRYLNVYEKDITDGVFDAKRSFVRTGDDSFEKIYTYSIISPRPVS